MTARIPATTMAGHLQWTTSGTVWATWRINPVPYGMRPVAEKEVVRGLHQAMWRSMSGEALALGLMAATDPVAVVERMLVGVDLEACPEWAAECEATLDVLEDIPLGERTMWLAVPLANTGWNFLREPCRSASAAARDALALPRSRPAPAVVDARLRQAQLVQDAIPGIFRPTQATAAEQVWMAAHAQRRGLVDVPVPTPADQAVAAMLAPRTGVSLPEPILDEGGQSDVDRSTLRRLNPLGRRYLKVTDPRAYDEGQPASYQCLAAVSDMPAGGMVFPGSEYLASLDTCGVDVDWALRLRINNRDKVLKRTRKAVRSLNDQYEQREGQVTTGHHELDLAAQLLNDYQATFANDEMEVEVEHTTVLAVGDVDPEAAQQKIKVVAAALARGDVKLDRPVGAMEALWWQMWPGMPTSQLTHQLAQFTTATDFACAVPFITATLGDPSGSALAENRAVSRRSIVHHSMDGHARLDVSPSIAVAGELGAGKTHTLLTLAGDVVDRGGQVMAIDRTSEGEYARFAATLPEHTIVDVQDPRVSMDPLRVFGLVAGSRIAQSFLTVLTGISPQSDLGDTMAEVLDPSYLERHGLTSLGAVVEHLAAQSDLEDAEKLARRMRTFAKKDLARVVFDPGLPAVRLDAPAIVWRTHGLELPSADELSSSHLFAQLRLEKIFGRAYYALLAAAARQCAFADPTRLSLLVCDEAHAINSSPEASAEVTLFIRQGRRANAAAALGSHDPIADFGDDTQRGLIRTRLLMRHTDETLARRALIWLGMDPADPAFGQYLDQLTKDTSPLSADGTGVLPQRRGEGFLRDVRGGIGPVRVLGPARLHRRQAALTTPGAATSSTSTPPSAGGQEPA